MFSIDKLDDAILSQLKTSEEFALSINIANSKTCEYYAVYDEAKVLAVFDLRTAPDAIKQMDIYYSNQLVMKEDLTLMELLERSMTALNILARIFDHVLPNKEATKTKIYASNPAAYMVFSIMARNLQEQGDYDVSLYSKWIEISAKRKEVGNDY